MRDKDIYHHGPGLASLGPCSQLVLKCEGCHTGRGPHNAGALRRIICRTVNLKTLPWPQGEGRFIWCMFLELSAVSDALKAPGMGLALLSVHCVIMDNKTILSLLSHPGLL